MRRGRREAEQQRLDRLIPGLAVYGTGVAQSCDRVRELHHGRDHRVEAKALNVAGNALDHHVRRARELSRRFGVRTARHITQDHVPDTIEPAPLTLNAGIVPVSAGFPRAQEHQVEANGIGAEAGDPLVWIDHVAAAFGHLRAVFGDRALVKQAGERLVNLKNAHVARSFGEKARIKQMHHSVLSAAGVLIDRQPVTRQTGIDWGEVIVRIDVSVHVPVGTHECVHRVGLAPPRLIALRTVDV